MKLRPNDVADMNFKPGAASAALEASAPYLMIAASVTTAQVLPVLAMPLAIFIGTRFRHINNIIHWASHGSACQNKEWNDGLGSMLCASIFLDFKEYKMEHLSHHVNLGDYRADNDFSKIEYLRIGEKIGVSRRIKTIFSIRTLKSYIPTPNFKSKSASIGALAYIAIVLWLVSSGFLMGAFTLLVGEFIIYPVIRYLTDLVDHGGIYSESEKKKKSRNCIIYFKPLRALIFPANDCFHKVHHDFPAISAHAQEAVHNRCMAIDSEYAAETNRAVDHLDNRLAKRPLKAIVG